MSPSPYRIRGTDWANVRADRWPALSFGFKVRNSYV